MTETLLTLGVINTSTKENEHRLPIHPDHLAQIAPQLKPYIFVEEDYGNRFDVDEAYLRQYVNDILPREELFKRCDIILLPKPTKADFPFFREGQILWGWPHCVQGQAITQMAIDKKMTMIAWEAMYIWKNAQTKGMHIFYKNNELAGYSSVLHALQLQGSTGHYGPHKRAAVMSFGSTGRGAVYALRGMGYTDITVYTQRPRHAVHNQIPAIRYRRYKRAKGDASKVITTRDKEAIPMAEEFSQYDIIVNCILQDTDRPIIFIDNKEVETLKSHTLIVDVSCDLGMGFEFARPTSFEDPTFQVGDRVTYYAVDHSPTHFWNSSTFAISAALQSYIPIVMGGPAQWEQDRCIHKAIEIREGEILNPKILHFQHREDEYPHKIRKDEA